MARQSSREETPDDKFYKEKYSTVPKLGTRVRRGPHWSYQNQDSEGPGTIVGHGDYGRCTASIIKIPLSHVTV